MKNNIEISMTENDAFWENELEHIGGFHFQADHYDYVMQNKEFEMEEKVLGEKIIEELNRFCKSNKCTPYHVMLTALMCALFESEYKEEIIVWTAVKKSFEIGTLNNMNVISLPICVKFLNKEANIAEILKKIMLQTARILDHQDVSLNEVLEKCENSIIQKYEEISNVFFNFTIDIKDENLFDVEEIILDEVGNTKYELNIDCTMSDNKIILQASYNCKLFRQSRIKMLLEKTKEYLDKMFSGQKISSVNHYYYNNLEQKKEVDNFDIKFNLLDEFLKNVRIKPDSDAIIAREGRLSYRQLYHYLLKVVLFLKTNNIEKGDSIAIIAEKNIGSIICIAALLFGGYTYIPISKDYPRKRIEEILNLCNIKGIIYDDSLSDFNETKIREFSITDIINFDISGKDQIELSYRDNNEIAYIMHTSGTMGKPKGVKISWGNLTNYCLQNGISKIIVSKSSFRILSVTNFEFDISITEIFLPFIYGGCCIIAPKNIEDENLFIKYIERNFVDVIQTTPTNLKRLMLFYKNNWMESLKLVLVGGETFPKTLYDDICKKTTATIINMYGPTETTVWSTCKIIEERPIYNIIGMCLYNYKIMIMQGSREADRECIGEICIGGESVAQGYVNDESLDKFRNIGGERFYLTGDMGRKLLSGEIEFVGRKDTQIKKGGYRIELEEIAEVAKEVYGVKNAITNIFARGKDEYICLYYIKSKKIAVEEIEKYLLRKLPKYMMPNYYIEIKELPLTNSGKINLKKLPIPNKEKNSAEDREYLVGEKKEIFEIIKRTFAINDISIKDNFWRIGGNSIKAVALVNTIEKTYGIRIKLGTVLASTNIREIIDYIDTSIKSNLICIEKYPATSAQKRIYALQTLNADNISYNMPALIRLQQYHDPLDIQKYIIEIINKFKILHTRFKIEENELWQMVCPYDGSCVQIVYKDDADPKEEIKSFVRPFSLEKDTLIRAEILVVGNDEYLFLDIHHIISDEVSNNRILDMLDASLSGKNLVFNEEAEYGEYSEFLKGKKFEEEEEAWKAYFEDLKVERLALPRDSFTDFSYMEGAKREILLPDDTLAKLHKVSIETSCSMYSILLSFLFILLKKICNQDIITVGCPTSHRNIEKYEKTLGLFVNTSIISEKVEDNKTIKTLIEEIQKRVLFAIENVDCPFEKIVNLCDVESIHGQNPVFDVMFNYYEDSEYIAFELQDTDIHTPKVDLTFSILENNRDLYFECEYVKHHYSENRIDSFLNRYAQLLSLYLGNLDAKISFCDICLPNEKEIILKTFNMPIEVSKYKDKCLQDYLAIQAQIHPDDIAIKMEDSFLTFKELNSESSKFASELIDYHVEVGEVIPLIICRSIEMFIGIWGILKAGGAYLPIKPNEPDTRMKYMVANAKAKHIVCGKEQYIKLLNMFPNLIIINADRRVLQNNVQEIANLSNSNSLAYVIYTSGTTGDPKGVMVEHGSIINRIEWMVNEYGINLNDTILFKTPFSFDVSVWEIFIGIFCGATVCILPDEEEKEPDSIKKAILKYNVSIIHFVPSMLNVFLDYLEVNKCMKTSLMELKYVVSSGEKLKKESVEKFYSLFSNSKLINLYGPTEATVDVTHYECTGREDIVPIGKPITNINIFILSGNTLTGIGIKGELCIAGIGVARGYINAPELTGKNFVDNIFGYGKMYRTGDVACWDYSGNILFFGRKDRQVKIRGNRIELGEIEEKMLTIKNVKDVKVFAEDSRLVANVVGQNEYVTSEDIKKELELILPSYMIPNCISIVPALELSNNGKAKAIRKKMDTIETNMTSDSYNLPLDITDKIILKVMTKVLKHNVNMNNTFTKVGGDSILAIFAANQLQKDGIEILSKDIIASKNFYDMKKYIKKVDTLPSKNTEKAYLPTPIMRDFWENWPIKDKNYFNQSCLLLIRNFDEERILYAIKNIIKHHEMLRAKFNEKGSFVIKEYSESMFDRSFEKVEIFGDNFSEELYSITSRVQKSISLEKEVLFRFVIINNNNQYYLFACIHHLIIDAVSWGIILYDLENIYENQLKLLPERLSFGEWTKLIENYQNKISILEKNYWLDIVQKMQWGIDSTNTFDLVKDKEYTFKYIDVTLLREIIKYKKLDEKSIVLALLVKALPEKESLFIDIESYGRSAIDEVDVSGTVGWFTVIFPMFIKSLDSIRSLTYSIYDNFDSVLNNGIAFGLLKDEFQRQGYEHLQSPYCFNYLGRSEDYICESFEEIHIERTGADVGKFNSMGYDIVFNVFEIGNVLRMKIEYKSCKEKEVATICKRLNRIQRAFLELI